MPIPAKRSHARLTVSPASPKTKRDEMKRTLKRKRSFHLSAIVSISTRESIKYRKIPITSDSDWITTYREDSVTLVALAMRTIPYKVAKTHSVRSSVSDFFRYSRKKECFFKPFS